MHFKKHQIGIHPNCNYSVRRPSIQEQTYYNALYTSTCAALVWYLLSIVQYMQLDTRPATNGRTERLSKIMKIFFNETKQLRGITQILLKNIFYHAQSEILFLIMYEPFDRNIVCETSSISWNLTLFSKTKSNKYEKPRLYGNWLLIL